MPILGLVGGLSWHASALYYQRINKEAERRYGAGATVETVLFTLCFADVLAAAQAGDWDGVNGRILAAANHCVDAGADLVMITAFTGHSAAQMVETSLSVPLVHAGDALADKTSTGQKVGLLGTRFMLDAGIIEERLRGRGLSVLQAGPKAANVLDDVILGDLTHGSISTKTHQSLDEAIDDVVGQGADRILLACTELPLLIADRPEDPRLIDGVAAHVETALDRLEGLQ